MQIVAPTALIDAGYAHNVTAREEMELGWHLVAMFV
jgi:hypothetical protein